MGLGELPPHVLCRLSSHVCIPEAVNPNKVKRWGGRTIGNILQGKARLLVGWGDAEARHGHRVGLTAHSHQETDVAGGKLLHQCETP